MSFKAKTTLSEKVNKKIVIIGAGLAGLTTAYRLLQKQYDIEVYEARPRVGGRVHTILMKNLDETYSLAELGAQNLTDAGSSTYIFNLIKEMGLEIRESYTSLDGQFYDGERFYRKNDILKKLNITNQLINEIDQTAKNSYSMQDVLDQVLKENQLAIRMFSFMLNGYEGLAPHLLSAHPHNVETLKNMLAGGLSHAHPSSKMHRMTIKGGNALLALKLAQIINDVLYLNKVLTKVCLQTDGLIKLAFADDTTVVCNQLILAIPAGVYKDIYFEEGLIEKNKLKLIQSIHYGTNGKMLIPIKIDKTYETFFFSDDMGTFFNQDQNILNCYFAHDNGINLFQPHAHAKTLSFLKKIYPTATFKETSLVEAKEEQFAKVDSPVVKSWVKDLYAKGSYSAYDVILQDLIHQKRPYQNIMVNNIFSPIADKIFFVGEHTTIIDEIGTMEAAVESAERITQTF